jgi:hypothetical protein
MEKARKEAAEAEEAARLEKLRLKEEARLAELLRMRKAKGHRYDEWASEPSLAGPAVHRIAK